MPNTNHSIELKELLDARPDFIVRCGISLMAGIAAVFIILSSIYQYRSNVKMPVDGAIVLNANIRKAAFFIVGQAGQFNKGQYVELEIDKNPEKGLISGRIISIQPAPNGAMVEIRLCKKDASLNMSSDFGNTEPVALFYFDHGSYLQYFARKLFMPQVGTK